MFPTLMAMTDSKMPATRPLDGKNIWPALRDNTASPVESYYWAWRNEDAIRTADWKLHRFFDHFELYDIRTDMSEATNVAEAHPDVVKSLTAKMNAWTESLGAALTHQPAPMKLNAQARARRRGARSHRHRDRTSETEGHAGRSRSPTSTAISSPPTIIEFDIAIAPRQPAARFLLLARSKATTTQAIALEFKRGEGIDQFGREQSTGPETQRRPRRLGTSRHRPVQQRPGHPAASRPCLSWRQTRHLQSLSRQPPPPPRRRQHHADLDQ